MENEIFDELKTELEDDPNFNEKILKVKIKNAIRDVRIRRNYKASTYSDDAIEKDMERFYVVILNVARYDYNQVGIEGEQAHSENGVNRTYVSRDSLMATVHPFVDVL